MFQNPQTPSIYPVGYYFGWDFPLWVVTILIGLLSVAIFIQRAKTVEIYSQKSLFLGIAFLFMFLSLARICFVLAVRDSNVNYDTIVDLGYIFQVVGMTCLFFEFERSFLKITHFGMTLFSMVGVIIGILTIFSLLSRDISRILSTVISTTDTVLIFLIFLYLIKNSTGEVRTRTILSFFGIILLFVGFFLDSEFVYGLWSSQPPILPPILVLIGFIVIIANQTPPKAQ